MKIIYDGDCPFCSDFARYSNLRTRLTEPIELINARDNTVPELQALAANYDFDEGMLVIYQGREYFGHAAVGVITSILDDRQPLRWLSPLFKFGWLSKTIYLILRTGRNLSLKISGKKRIGSK